MSMLTQALRLGRADPRKIEAPAPARPRDEQASPRSDASEVAQRIASAGAARGELADTRHVLHLPSLDALRGAAGELRQDGRFLEFDNGPEGWQLAVVQSIALEPPEILALQAELEATARRAGGTYAGWEIVAPAL